MGSSGLKLRTPIGVRWAAQCASGSTLTVLSSCPLTALSIGCSTEQPSGRAGRLMNACPGTRNLSSYSIRVEDLKILCTPMSSGRKVRVTSVVHAMIRRAIRLRRMSGSCVIPNPRRRRRRCRHRRRRRCRHRRHLRRHRRHRRHLFKWQARWMSSIAAHVPGISHTASASDTSTILLRN